MMSRPDGLGYQPAIDGLRAIAVGAVIIYHAQQTMPTSWIPGGFLGVEVFFAISGYLITTLIINEYERSGSLNIRQFWLRRARRLLPALIALLVFTASVVGIGGAYNESLREHVRAFRGMWASAWVYITNWYQIGAGLNYGDNVGRPPLLRHLWSLAVEEQFYLLWPVVMWVVLRWFGGRPRLVATAFTIVAVGVSAVTALAYESENLWRINFLYLSTPTRATGLLLGSALAFLWQPWRRSTADAPARRSPWVDATGALALAGLVVLFARWHFTTETEIGTRGYDPLFVGGFLLVGALTVVLLIAATHPASLLGRRLLAASPLAWIGKRSYGLYLWHWPVFQLLRPRGDQSLLNLTQPDVDLPWLPVLAIRLAITLLLTELSYRLLEMPIRRGAIGDWWRRTQSPAFRSAVLLAVCVPLAAITTVSSVAAFRSVDQLALDAACNQNPEECGQALGADETGDKALLTPPSDSEVAEPAPVADSIADAIPPPTDGVAVSPSTAPSDVTASSAVSTTAQDPLRSDIDPLAIGDSVMVGARSALQRAGIVVDAEIKRGFAAAIPLVKKYRRQQKLGDILIVGLGTGGGITESQVDRLMNELEAVRHVVFITPQTAGRHYEESSRAALLSAATRYPNVSIIDWWQLSQPKMQFYEGADGIKFEDLYFYRDRVHLVSKGRRFFADLIIAEVERLQNS